MHGLHEESAGARVGNGSLSRPESKPLFWEADLKAIGLLDIVANVCLPESRELSLHRRFSLLL